MRTHESLQSHGEFDVARGRHVIDLQVLPETARWAELTALLARIALKTVRPIKRCGQSSSAANQAVRPIKQCGQSSSAANEAVRPFKQCGQSNSAANQAVRPIEQCGQ